MKRLLSLAAILTLLLPVLRAATPGPTPKPKPTPNPNAAILDEALMPGQPVIHGRPIEPLNLPPTLELVKNIPFGKGGDRELYADIIQPKTPPAEPMPAVIWIHGGGWRQGTYHRIICTVPLAKRGFFIASTEYRLTGEADGKWPAQLQDAKLAVRWLRANAEKYHVDPNRIAVWGESAGGHLVVFLGVSGDMPQYEGTGGYPGVSSKVQAVVDDSGPVSFLHGSEGMAGSTPTKDTDSLVALFGGSFAQKPADWKAGSPIIYVKAGDPPFLIVHGDADKLVPMNQSTRLLAALQKAGVPAQMITVHGGGHDLLALPGQPPASPTRETLAQMICDFLDAHMPKEKSGNVSN